MENFITANKAGINSLADFSPLNSLTSSTDKLVRDSNQGTVGFKLNNVQQAMNALIDTIQQLQKQVDTGISLSNVGRLLVESQPQHDNWHVYPPEDNKGDIAKDIEYVNGEKVTLDKFEKCRFREINEEGNPFVSHK